MAKSGRYWKLGILLAFGSIGLALNWKLALERWPVAVIGFATLLVGQILVGELMSLAPDTPHQQELREKGALFVPWLSGLLERLVFFVLSLLASAGNDHGAMSTLLPAAGGWIALRLALNWTTRLRNTQDPNFSLLSTRAQYAFWAYVFNILIAFIGGIYASTFI